jgi:hypothetical protein
MGNSSSSRITIDKVDQRLAPEIWKPTLADSGRRRHLSYTMDFDTRVYGLEEPGDGWSEEAKRLHEENKAHIKRRLEHEFGTDGIEQKIANFIAIGTKPFSVLAHHNRFFDQVRRAFVVGAYYPALVGACALGERILNHLILDLRESYRHTPEYKKVYRKASFDDWRLPIDSLEAWQVLLPEAVAQFRQLMTLRHRSIHFNPSTYLTLREDALAALHQLREIIDLQFGSWGIRPWFIAGTRGHIFIKREWASNPFIRTYFIPTCPFVGPYFAISFDGGLRFHDHVDYGDGEWTDEEFAAAFEARSPDQVVKT